MIEGHDSSKFASPLSVEQSILQIARIALGSERKRSKLWLC